MGQLLKSRKRRVLGVSTLALLTAASLAACGSSSKKSNGGSGSSGSSSSSAANGEPIVIASQGSLTNPTIKFPDIKAGMDAAVQAINAKGGVNGRPLKLNYCDGGFTGAGDLGCTRDIINSTAVAQIFPLIATSDASEEYALMQKAGLASVGTIANTTSELTNPVSFPSSSGVPGWLYGATENLLSHGATKISIISGDSAGLRNFATIATAALKSAGLAPVHTVFTNATTDPTLQSAAAAGMAGSDGLLIWDTNPNMDKLIPALRRLGYKGLIAGISGTYSQDVLKAIGSDGNGILVTGQTDFVSDTANPAMAEFIAAMKKYESADLIDANSLQAWIGVQMFAGVAKLQKTVTRESILSGLNSLSTAIDLGGLVAPYKVVGSTSPLPDTAPRVFSPFVAQGVIKDGDQFSDGKGLINPFTKLPTYAGK